MMMDVLKLKTISCGRRVLSFFPELSAVAESLLRELPNARPVELGGTRAKSIVQLPEGTDLVLLAERPAGCEHRQLSEPRPNTSLKEALIARALSGHGEFEDECGRVRFARPLGVLEDGPCRSAVFFRETVCGSDGGVNFNERAFAYFVMLLNGIYHKEGPKDFLPIPCAGRLDLFVVDFEHAEFVASQDIFDIVDFVLALDRVNPRVRDALGQWRLDSRSGVSDGWLRGLMMENLHINAPGLYARVAPYLATHGYVDGDVVPAPAHPDIMRIPEILEGQVRA